jgi:hypothetical protein
VIAQLFICKAAIVMWMETGPTGSAQDYNISEQRGATYMLSSEVETVLASALAEVYRIQARDSEILTEILPNRVAALPTHVLTHLCWHIIEIGISSFYSYSVGHRE